MESATKLDPSRRTARDRPADADARRFGAALLPVRLFLGVTFVYAGIQKLTDPGFLHPGAPTYIGTQLTGFSHGTPGGFLLRAFAIPHPRASGVLVALAEIAVGLLVTAGVLTRLASAVGLALNALLFFTNSWHTYPYFLGSDIVFVFAWLPFVVVGAAWQPSLEPTLGRLASQRAARARPGRAAGAGVAQDVGVAHDAGARAGGRTRVATGALQQGTGPELTRRRAIALGLTAAATAVIGGLSLLARGNYRAPRSLGLARGGPKASAASGATTHTTGTQTSQSPGGQAPADIAAPGSAGALPAGAVKLGPASRLPAGQAATYADPRDGSPDIVIRESNGSLVAHSAVCTHAGCTVGYQGGQIVCPCHGAVYDAQTGAVISGPAPAPLAARRVIEQGGEIYAVPS